MLKGDRDISAQRPIAACMFEKGIWRLVQDGCQTDTALGQVCLSHDRSCMCKHVAPEAWCSLVQPSAASSRLLTCQEVHHQGCHQLQHQR